MCPRKLSCIKKEIKCNTQIGKHSPHGSAHAKRHSPKCAAAQPTGLPLSGVPRNTHANRREREKRNEREKESRLNGDGRSTRESTAITRATRTTRCWSDGEEVAVKRREMPRWSSQCADSVAACSPRPEGFAAKRCRASHSRDGSHRRAVIYPLFFKPAHATPHRYVRRTFCLSPRRRRNVAPGCERKRERERGRLTRLPAATPLRHSSPEKERERNKEKVGGRESEREGGRKRERHRRRRF